MTQIVHISDTHLGHRQYGSDVRRQDFIDGLAAGVKRAIGQEVDAMIHTGDLFHRRTPPLPEVNQCIDILREAADEGIPFLGIVGNHDRKMDDQWLDLIEQTGTAARLDTSPTMVGDDFAVYGIDAISTPAWESAEFELDEPDNDDAYRLLCMHQLLHPPVPEVMAEYTAEEVIDRLNIEIDGLALGDYHEAESDRVRGVDVWYAGSTERGSSDEQAPRSVTLLGVDNGSLTRQQLDLDTRPFRTIDIGFDEDEGYAHARNKIENHEITDAVALVNLTGKRTSLTASDVHKLVLEMGAAVGRVNDERGREHLDVGDAPSTEVEDPDTLIETRVADATLSEPALDVEEAVRGDSTATASLADEAEALITEAQESAFSNDESGELADPDRADPPERADDEDTLEPEDEGEDESRDEGTADEPEPEPDPDAEGEPASNESDESDSEAASDDAPGPETTDTDREAADEPSPPADDAEDESPGEAEAAQASFADLGMDDSEGDST